MVIQRNEIIYKNKWKNCNLNTPLGNRGLFIDSSTVSLKAVLLHNGNKFPSAPLANAVHVKETYENLQVLLQKICYEEHWRNMRADLRVMEVLTGLQGRYTKFCCF